MGCLFAETLGVVGRFDIGIDTKITSIIPKDKNATLRNITIASHDGLFQGHLTIGVSDTHSLSALIKKIQTVKGVKEVQRTN